MNASKDEEDPTSPPCYLHILNDKTILMEECCLPFKAKIKLKNRQGKDTKECTRQGIGRAPFYRTNFIRHVAFRDHTEQENEQTCPSVTLDLEQEKRVFTQRAPFTNLSRFSTH